MKENDFVYSLTNGIGIIKEMFLDTITVLYENNLEVKENYYDVTPISNNAIDLLKNDEFYDMLPEVSIERADDIVEQKRIKKIAIMDSNLTSLVKGSGFEDYRVNITFTKKGFRASCSCPVQTSNCKHVAAVLIELSNKIKGFKSNIIQSDFTNYVSDIKSKISTRSNLENLDNFSLYLNQCNIDDIKNNLNLLESISDNKKLEIIVGMIYFNLHSKNVFNSYFNGYPRINNVLNKLAHRSYIFDALTKDLYVEKTNDMLYYLIAFLANQKYEKLFVLAINNTNDSSIYTDFLFEKIKIDKKIIDSIYDYRGYDYWRFEYLKRDIFDKASMDLKLYIMENYSTRYVDISTISNFPFPKQLSILKNYDNSKEALKYINDNYYAFYDLEPKKLFSTIFIHFDAAYKADRNKTISLLMNDKEAINFVYLLDKTKCNIDAFNPYAFFKYYDYKVKMYPEPEDGCVKVFISIFLDDIEIMTLTYGNYISFESSYDKEYVDKYNKDILDYVEDNSPNFKEEYNQKYAEIKAIIDEKKKKEYIYKIKKLSSIVNRIDDKLIDKVELKYVFSKKISYRTYHTTFEMEIKVGINKFYIVKDFVEFLDNIEKNKNVKYGKELEFNHNIDNFSEIDKNVINYLLTLPYEDYYRGDRRTLLLPIKCFDVILNLLKGKTIIYNNKEYLVKLDQIKPDISIDDNFILKSNINDENLLELKKLYYLDNNLGIINEIISDEKTQDLICFAGENNNMDLSIVKQEFMDEIYPNFIDSITVPDVIRNEYQNNLIKIEAYFDYQKGKITCETKIFKKDVLLTSDSFMNSTDKTKFLKYSNYLERLGFIDSKELIDQRLILKFFNLDFKELRNLCDVYLSDTIKNKSVSKLVTPSIRIQYENNMMEAFLEESEYSSDELVLIMKAIRQKKNFILLDNDRIIDLDDKEAFEFSEAINDLRLDIKNLYQKQRIETYDALKAYAYLDNCSVDEYISKMVLDIKNFKSLDFKLPELSIGTKLRKYQKEAFKWLNVLAKYHMGGILADDMGLGKTLEVITAIKANDDNLPSLIVCPKSLLFNWYSEFEKFDGETDVRMIYGNSDIRKNRILGINPDKKVIYITAYDSLRNDIELFQNLKFNYLILDEAQNIKNVNAQKSLAVKQIDASYRFALTGTPIENNIIDLWSIFDFVMPGYLQDLNNFKARYLNNNSFNEIIRKKVAPFILRRTKEEVLNDLPPKYERIVSCDMNTFQRKIYDAHINDAKIKLDEGLSVEVLAYLTRLRQICVSPKLFVDEYEHGSGKLEYLREMIPTYINDGHRILIFSSFVSGLNMVASLLKELNIRYLILTGDTKLEQRKIDTDEFNKNEDIKVYLISLKAGGTGLNLVGADTVIHLDPWWNVSAENQATDRAHRIGQTRNVEVIKLVASESIEERVIELQNIKRKVIEDIISDNDKSITTFSLEDMKFILS